MTTKLPPLKILLGQEFLQVELLEKLTAAGHVVDTIPAEYDVVLGHQAWRVPPGSTPAEVSKYITMVLKQVRATKHAQNPAPEKSTPGVHKVPGKRGKKAKVATPPTPATDTTKLDDASTEGC